MSVPLVGHGRRLDGTVSRLVSSMPRKPIASATAAIIAIGLVAAYIPARRAARVEPLEALRHE